MEDLAGDARGRPHLSGVVTRIAGRIAPVTWWIASGCAIAGWAVAAPVAGQALTVDAPPSLDWAAERVMGVDWSQLGDALMLAGLEMPARIEVVLIAENDVRAVHTPRWIVGIALPPTRVEIVPERTASYPYGSIESVVRHEVAHLALSSRAGDYDLPRWFHEGVAVAVEGGWGMADQVRLLGAIASGPPIEELGRLFGTGERPDSARAYLLATALVDYIRRQHGASVPGAVAAQVADGVPFAQAFLAQTGESVDEATAGAWGSYLRWTNRILAIVNPSSVWTAILVLAVIAFMVQRRRRADRRRQWDDEEV